MPSLRSVKHAKGPPVPRAMRLVRPPEISSARTWRPSVASCRSCGRPVRWVETERGKLMPIDPEPSTEGTILLRRQLDRKPLAIVGVPPAAFIGEDRFVSHFSTCPDHKEW